MAPLKGLLSPFCQGTIIALPREAPAGINIPMPLTFREALLKAIERPGPSLQAVATGSGVSYEQLKKIKQGKSLSTNVEDALSVAKFFGKTLEQFLEDPSFGPRSEIVSLYNQLSETEQKMLLAAAKGLAAQQDQGMSKPDEEPQ